MIQSFLCIPHIPVGNAGGRAPTVGALGDAGAVTENFYFKASNLEIGAGKIKVLTLPYRKPLACHACQLRAQ
jgi:hypothetical protein